MNAPTPHPAPDGRAAESADDAAWNRLALMLDVVLERLTATEPDARAKAA